MLTLHQQKQREVIHTIEEQIRLQKLDFSTVDPVNDFIHDKRLCLTSVHLLKKELTTVIKHEIQIPLSKMFPNCYVYPETTLHMTIKNCKVVHDPPTYTKEHIVLAKQAFDAILPKRYQFRIFPFKLLLFPTNVSLIGTTDSELDTIHVLLDKQLRDKGIPDDKVYLNSKYFFSNITLIRFNGKAPVHFEEKLKEISHNLHIAPYIVDSVTLLTGNASLRKRDIIKTWKLKAKEVSL